MWQYLLVIALLVPSFGGSSVPEDAEDKRIIGGRFTGFEEFETTMRYLMAVMYRPTGKFICSASAISRQFLLSVSTCFSDPYLERYEVRNMWHKWTLYLKARDIRYLLMHNRGRSATRGPGNFNNLAIIIVDYIFDNVLKPLNLPGVDDGLKPGDEVVTGGWGQDWVMYRKPMETAKMVTLKIMDNEACLARLPYINMKKNPQLCTVPPEHTSLDSPYTMCHYDFGNPLVINSTHTIVGIFSHHRIPCNFFYPPVFQRIGPLVPYIRKQMEDYGHIGRVDPAVLKRLEGYITIP